MNKISKVLAIASVGLTVFAQEEPKATRTKSESAEAVQAAGAGKVSDIQAISPLNKASCVIGMAIKDADGKALGKVQDLVVDLENGKLGYAVIALEGDRVVPVPVSALKPAESGDHFVLNMSASVLAAAPSVANDQWPALDAFAVGGPATSEKGQGSSSDVSTEK